MSARRFQYDPFPVTPFAESPLFGIPAKEPSAPFDRSTIQPSAMEALVAGIVWKHQGRHNAISIEQLTELTKLGARGVKEVVEQLRLAHRCRIGANRQEPYGYFWIVDAADHAAAVAAYRAQILSMWRTLQVLDDDTSLRELLGQLKLED
jgi:hypothetical protein